MKTVLITGSSSGIGRESVKYFLKKGWNVVATMRSPEKETEFTQIDNVLCLQLDVENEQSIEKAIKATITHFGKIDVLVNNAGYAAVGAFEAASPEQVKKQFDVNVFGLMNVSRAILPYFRKQRSGTIINVASVAGKVSFPTFSLYNATKFAVEGFSEALQFELRDLDILVKVIEPGPINTDFYGRSMDVLKKEGLTDYDSFINKAIQRMNEMGTKGHSPVEVAKVIFKAASSNSHRIYYPVAYTAKTILLIKRVIPGSWLRAIIRKAMS